MDKKFIPTSQSYSLKLFLISEFLLKDGGGEKNFADFSSVLFGVAISKF